MLLTADMPESSSYTVHDFLGRKIPFVLSFDTETCEIELAIRIGTHEDGNPLLLAFSHPEDPNKVCFFLPKFILTGAYAEKNGQRL